MMQLKIKIFSRKILIMLINANFNDALFFSWAVDNFLMESPIQLKFLQCILLECMCAMNRQFLKIFT